MSERSDEPDRHAVEVAKITITKYIDPTAQGGMSIYVDYGTGLALVDALGMIAFAQGTAFDVYMEDDDDD